MMQQCNPGYILERSENIYPCKLYSHMFIVVLFLLVKTWKQPKCLSIDKKVNKIWYIHITEYYTTIKY